MLPDRKIELALAAAITLATAVNVGVTALQWGVARGQLTVMRVDQRAWIKAPIRIDGDLTYNSDIGLSLPFHFDLTNIGHAPAFNVRTLAFLYTPQDDNEDYTKVWKTRCEDFKRGSDEIKAYGAVIFPAETAPSNDAERGAVSVLSNNLVNQGILATKSTHIRLFIIGCIDYTIDNTREHHQTGFFYRIRTIPKETGVWNIFIDAHVGLNREDIIPIPLDFTSEMIY
jgi:hypothetical protein